jgi:hypothetical protein
MVKQGCSPVNGTGSGDADLEEERSGWTGTFTANRIPWETDEQSKKYRASLPRKEIAPG